MVHAVHRGRDEEPAQKSIDRRRNAQIRMGEEILDNNHQPGTRNGARWRSQEPDHQQLQALRNETLNRMKAKPGG